MRVLQVHHPNGKIHHPAKSFTNPSFQTPETTTVFVVFLSFRKLWQATKLEPSWLPENEKIWWEGTKNSDLSFEGFIWSSFHWDFNDCDSSLIHPVGFLFPSSRIWSGLGKPSVVGSGQCPRPHRLQLSSNPECKLQVGRCELRHPSLLPIVRSWCLCR